tara:strand:+ start:277 stop:759 length:483 start_codon:yes stop_codon:yes gene_type:complete
MKKVLDVCCGSRAMWFDKNDKRALYLDKRNKDYNLEANAAYPNGGVIKIKPDIVGDFTNIKQPDNSFWHIVFDPPHITRKAITGDLTKRYGILEDGWQDIIRKGFKECFRVLKPNGTLIFKWSEVQIPIKDVLKLTKHKPLYGHKSGKRMNTHWVCFIKD